MLNISSYKIYSKKFKKYTFLFGIIDLFFWKIAAFSFVPARGKEVHSGNIEAVSTKEKSKFPQDFFPEVRVHLKIYWYIPSMFSHVHCVPNLSSPVTKSSLMFPLVTALCCTLPDNQL
jgi:hypothetical protein